MKVLLQKRRLLYLAAVMMLSYVMVHHVVQRVDVYGVSMEPNYVEGDIILANKVCLYFSEIERFDAVVFQYEYQDDEFYIKRVIGLPGETVQIVDGQVYIDGALLDDIYATEPIEKPRRAAEPVVLGEDEYFLLGDNRNDSSDSRDSDIGNVSASQIIGKAGVRIWRGER
ncbi:MAG: signal peptidase I [Hungatella hathewayi]|nr:signal peptidase I [Hungatella hathewayi]